MYGIRKSKGRMDLTVVGEVFRKWLQDRRSELLVVEHIINKIIFIRKSHMSGVRSIVLSRNEVNEGVVGYSGRDRSRGIISSATESPHVVERVPVCRSVSFSTLSSGPTGLRVTSRSVHPVRRGRVTKRNIVTPRPGIKGGL